MTPPLPPPWPILLIVLPLAAALLAFALPRLAGWAALLAMAAVPALLLPLTALVGPDSALLYPLGGWPSELGIGLLTDGLSLWLLWVGAVVNIAIGFYARRYFLPDLGGGSTTASGHYFPPLWLMLWAAFNGVLLSADLFNIYVGLELLGLAAVCLAALGDSQEARRAALRYLLLNLFGSLSFLLAVVMIYRQTGSLNLDLFRELVAPDPLIHLALALLSLGLIIKSALFPLHFWLPPAHAQATAPVSALLSALVVKASLYLLLRIWLSLKEGGALDPTLLFQLFGILGAAAIFWGSLQALRCAGFKELIAYSTVAQMGYLFLVFPLLSGPEPASALYGLLFFLAAHALAKAALFLVAGTIAKQHRLAGKADQPLLISHLTGLSRTLPLSSLTLALAAVSLMGLPPSGGFVGKWYLLHAALTSRQWWWTTAIIGGGLLSLAYLLRPVARTFTRSAADQNQGGVPGQRSPIAAAATSAGERQVAWPLEGPALLLALTAILLGIFPWLPLEWLGGSLPGLKLIAPGATP